MGQLHKATGTECGTLGSFIFNGNSHSFYDVRGLMPPKCNVLMKNKSHIKTEDNLSCSELCKIWLLKVTSGESVRALFAQRVSQNTVMLGLQKQQSKLFIQAIVYPEMEVLNKLIYLLCRIRMRFLTLPPLLGSGSCRSESEC